MPSSHRIHRGASILLAVAPLWLATAAAVGQSTRSGDFDNNLVRPMDPTGATSARGRDPIAGPGGLRQITRLGVSGNNQRISGNELGVSGNRVGISGESVGVIGIPSPLQNDAYFNGRLRPRVPAFGVTGYAVEPGWNDPPWENSAALSRPPPATERYEEFGRSVSERAGYGSGVGDGVADGSEAASARRSSRVYIPAPMYGDPEPDGAGPGEEPTAGAPRGAARAPRSARPPTLARSVSAPGPGAARAADDARPPNAGPARDVRPDLRMAARLALSGRAFDAVDTVRQSVYRSPGSFSGERAVFAGDPGATEALRRAVEVFREPERAGVSGADGRFMVAALSGALGEPAAAQEAIRQARELGESRPSGRVLEGVLMRGLTRPERPEGGGRP